VFVITDKKVLIHMHDVSHVEPLLKDYTVIYTGYTFSLTTLRRLKEVPWVDPFNVPLQLLHLLQHTLYSSLQSRSHSVHLRVCHNTRNFH
jgi:hypothetical protein